MSSMLMIHKNLTGSPSESSNSNDSPPAPLDPVFDQWLTHHLGQLYDPVLNETVPDDLLRLLQQKLG